MSRFDRYMLSQLMTLFGFFSLVLVMVYWVNQAVQLFNRLIADGQSALIFLEFTALTLPNVIRLVLPVSAFAAAVYVTNRLSSESELTVAQSTGMSSFRLARGVLAFGVVVALLMSVLVHGLVPASRAMMAERQAEMSANFSARYLTEGKFLHPATGVTMFIRHISRDGALEGLFLSDARRPGERTTYTAQRAFLVKANGTPKLVMVDGMAQTLRGADRRLSVTSFKDFTYDIGALIHTPGKPAPTVDTLGTWALLHPDPATLKAAGSTPSAFLFAANARLAEPLVGMAAALLGFAPLLLGGFSRFGLGRQILFAIVLLIGMQLLLNGAESLSENRTGLWPLAYAPPLYGFAVSAVLLALSQRRHHRRRRTARSAEAPA